MKRNRLIRPLILVGAGVLFVALAIAVLLIYPPGATPNPTVTAGEVATNTSEVVPRISLADAKAAYDLKQAVFIDTRGEPYYSESHIPGALSITLSDLETQYTRLNPKDWIILYCT